MPEPIQPDLSHAATRAIYEALARITPAVKQSDTNFYRIAEKHEMGEHWAVHFQDWMYGRGMEPMEMTERQIDAAWEEYDHRTEVWQQACELAGEDPDDIDWYEWLDVERTVPEVADDWAQRCVKFDAFRMYDRTRGELPF